MTCQGVRPVAVTRNPASRVEAGVWAVGGQGTTNKSWGWLQQVRLAVGTTEYLLLVQVGQCALGFLSCEFLIGKGAERTNRSALHCTDRCRPQGGASVLCVVLRYGTA